MYLFDLLKLQDIKISDAEAYAAWEKAKREDARLKTIPVDQGLEMIKGRMVMASAMEKQRSSAQKCDAEIPHRNQQRFRYREHM
jgi:hypothetical protein